MPVLDLRSMLVVANLASERCVVSMVLSRRSKNVENSVYFFGFNRTVQFESSKAENTEVLATTYDLINTWSLEIERGRYFTESEAN